MSSMQRLIWIVLLAFAAVILAGCAKEVEPEANPTETSSANGTAQEEPEALPPLKLEPEEGDEVVILETERGTIVVMFYPERAPQHVANFKALVREGFYDGTRFHRCIPGFMIQGGDPNSKDLANFDRRSMNPVGGGGNRDEMDNEVNVPLEPSDIRHVRGVLSMARSENPNSASSQFFLMHQASAGLDGQYSAFGKIVSGIEVVDEIVVTGNPADNGSVVAGDAVMLKKATLATWPLAEGAGE